MSIIICPNCGSHAEYNSHFGAYRCLNKYCNYYKDICDLTDEDKIYFNKFERYERWELDKPVESCEFITEDLLNIVWKDGTIQNISKENLLKAVLKLVKKEIRK